MKSIRSLLFVGLTFLAATGSQPVRAQLFAGPVSPGGDEQLLREVTEGRKTGVGAVLLNATEGRFGSCEVAGIVSGKKPPLQISSSYALGDDVRKVPAGEYVLTRVRCGRTTTNGPHAKFTVKPGEVVNVGSLRMDKKLAGLAALVTLDEQVKRSIVEMPPGLLGRATQRYPRTMALAVKRPMVLLGPQDALFHNKIKGAFQPQQ